MRNYYKFIHRIVLVVLLLTASTSYALADILWDKVNYNPVIESKSNLFDTTAIGSALDSSLLNLDNYLSSSFSAPIIAPRALPMPRITRTPEFGVFHSVAISIPNLPDAAKWREAMARPDYAKYFSAECGALHLQGCDSEMSKQLQSVSVQAKSLSQVAAMRLINRQVNATMTYQSDIQNWGQDDYWATLDQMAISGAGDCEDYAIAKFWMLRDLGVDKDQMQLVVLNETNRNIYHAVLVVHLNGQAYVLDNLSNTVRQDVNIANYKPIMSFAGDNSYIHGFNSASSTVAS